MDLNSHSSGPSHERWLISYADFVTLLLAVFVVLFASANNGDNRAREISEAVVEALTNGAIHGKSSHPRKPGSPSSQAAQLEPSLQVLTEELSQEIKQGNLSLRLEQRGLVISLNQAAFFGSAQSTLNPDTYPITDRIAKVIAALPNQVRLEGHTDAVPIRNSHYSSNWELSAARSIAVLHQLAERNQISMSRLSIAGFADTEPLGPNDSEEGRARNRRVDVVILNEIHNSGK